MLIQNARLWALVCGALCAVAVAGCSSSKAAGGSTPGDTPSAQGTSVSDADALKNAQELGAKMMTDQMAAQQTVQQHSVPMPAAEAADADLKLADPGTPQVSGIVPKFVIGGQTIDVMIAGKDFRAKDTVTAGPNCHLKSSSINSSHQVQVSLTVDDVAQGKCAVTLTNSFGPTQISIEMQPSPKAAAQALKDMQKQMEDRSAQLKAQMGTRWDVTLPNGKSATWTVDEISGMGVVEMKTSTGDAINIMVGQDNRLTVMADGCMLNGKLDGSNVQGTSILPSCPMGSGAWSAVLRK
jgi:hypothetical protein